MPHESLQFSGFAYQYSAQLKTAPTEISVVLATQPIEGDILPLIFDITSAENVQIAVDDWEGIVKIIQNLRSVRNLVFNNTLTPKCLLLFK